MKRRYKFLLAMLGALLLAPQAKAVDYVQAPPLSQAVKGTVKACGQLSVLPVPMIAWGGDMATIYANGNAEQTAQGSIFQKKGLSVRLYRQDRLVQQIEDYLSCTTPFLRGTLGMAAMASDVLNQDPRTAPVVIFQMTWSEGGDVLVAREHIKAPKDLCGKTVAMQAYGPHVDLLTTVLKDAGCPGQVTIKWVRDITEVAKDPKSTYPAKVLREDKSVDAVFVISADVDGLTKGKGEGVVKGAWAMFSTKTPNRVIADVYVVRKDYLDANPQKVADFVHAQMLAQEAVAKLSAEKAAQKKPYDEWLKASAKMLLDSADSTSDAEGMYGDAYFVGWKGNVSFFADDAYPRSFGKLTQEVGTAFGAAGLKLIAKPVSFTPAAFDYAKLSEGIQDKAGVEASRFNRDAVEQIIRSRQQQNKMSEGRLFSFEIRFAPNQQDFTADHYGVEFDRVIELMSTYGGALLTIEGHADTLAYLKRKAEPTATPQELSRMKQGAKNLTLQRANKVRDSLLAYAAGKKVTLDANQFAAVGHGFDKPNVPGCFFDKDGDVTAKCAPRTKDEWDAMRRVEFSVVSVEAEAETFQALK